MIRHPRKKKLQDCIAPNLLSTNSADCQTDESAGPRARNPPATQREVLLGMETRGLRLCCGSSRGKGGMGTNSRRKEDASVETAYGFEVGFII